MQPLGKALLALNNGHAQQLSWLEPERLEHLIEQAFLARTARARILPLPDGQPQQWLPGAEHDGFYYALIQKQA